MRLVRGGALAAVALAGCSFNASPAAGLKFAAPPGWKPSPGIMGFMQFWQSPGGEREALVLVKSPRPIKIGDIFQNGELSGTVKNATVERQEATTICARQPAIYAEALGESSGGAQAHVELMMTNVAGASYIAMYIRPAGASPNPMAESALRLLCPTS